MAPLWDRQIRAFAGLKFPKFELKTPWMHFYGDPGTGKTTTARWLMKKLNWEQWEITNTVEFIEVLRGAAEHKEPLKQYFDTLGTHPRMIIDDLGIETQDHFNDMGTRYTPSEIFETCLFRRHEYGLITITTSNLSPFEQKDPDTGKTEISGIEDFYGPKINSRMLEMATVYHFKENVRNDDDKDELVVEKMHTGSGKVTIPWKLEPIVPIDKPATPAGVKKAFENMPGPMKTRIRRVFKKMGSKIAKKYGIK